MSQQNPLGQESQYIFEYDASVLFSIPRGEARAALPEPNVNFHGVDLWTAYELSWLNQQGVPQMAIAEIEFSSQAPNLVESKSLKLYLNSFNQTRLANREALTALMAKDLAKASGHEVAVRLYAVNDFPLVDESSFQCLDTLDLSCSQYDIDAGLLNVEQTQSQQRYCSHVFRSLCPVTGQPDWASIYIELEGLSLQPESLLQYLVSYRQHQGFHEQCVEFIYQHLLEVCQAESLTISARFLRRGGLDINPIRSSKPIFYRPGRQVRQ